MSTVFNFIFWLTITLLVGLILRLFVLAIYHVPTPSMEPTIMTRDWILALKPLLPSQKVPERRGVWLFRKPNVAQGEPDVMVKRLIGISGDTVSITNGTISVNEEEIANVIPQDGMVSINTFFYPNIIIFPNDTTKVKWTGLNFGPLWVPSKGSTIILNEENKVLYRKVIMQESPEIRIDSGGCFWENGTKVKEYTFMENYYFACGDYIFVSNDSRHWGFIPESHLLSNAKLVLLSSDLKMTLNGSFFKKIQ